LNSIIEGLQSQLGAVRQQKEIEQAAKGLGGTNINKIVSVEFSTKGTPNDPTMAYKIKNARDDAKEWVYGRNLKITNTDLEPVQITIATTFAPNQRWFSVPRSSFQISAGSTEEITFTETPGNTSYDKRDKTVFYSGTISITVTRKDNTTETKPFKTTLKIAHPKSYDGF
jgi:hypothetical protein